jgi:hypothetical protein
VRNPRRKIAFVLAGSDHGTLIVNRFDYRMVDRSAAHPQAPDRHSGLKLLQHDLDGGLACRRARLIEAPIMQSIAVSMVNQLDLEPPRPVADGADEVEDVDRDRRPARLLGR